MPQVRYATTSRRERLLECGKLGALRARGFIVRIQIVMYTNMVGRVWCEMMVEVLALIALNWGEAVPQNSIVK
jgi:hypothetical protein